ncbi:MAG: hypothetical protein IJE10_10950 [Clostridia bacterium]|nr:hypothetical protein [Clostridia bacterium]
MNEKLKAFFEAKKEEELKKQEELNKKQEEAKKKTLIDLGLFEKVYSPDNKQSDEFSCYEWDSQTQTSKYYKKVPIDVSDEEYEEVKKYSKQTEDVILNHFNKDNPIATALTVIAWIVFIGGFIAGIVLGTVEVERGYYYTYTDTEFSFAIAFVYWCASLISGTMFLGFAEIIKLLNEIRNK